MLRDLQTAQGVLELNLKGFGFLRDAARNFTAQPGDAYVPPPLMQKHRLREGMFVAGPIEPSKKGTGPRLLEVTELEGMDPGKYQRRNFDELTPIDPHEHIRLETGASR